VIYSEKKLQNIYKSDAIQVIEIGEVLQLGWYLTDNIQRIHFPVEARTKARPQFIW
jgi:hypothetical protein